jgi:hypothetical protein
MTTWNTFVRSALFAAVVAALWFPWAILVAPLVGLWQARALYLTAVTALYIGGLGPRRAHAVPVAIVTAVVGAAVVAVVGSTAELAIALALLIAIARSGLLYRANLARALMTEAVLLGAGLLFARFLGGYTLISTALAIWGFLLVQSTFFLIGGVRARQVVECGDAFDEAHRRALVLLDHTGV